MNNGESIQFDYTGNVQSFIIPQTGVYKLEVWGAQGGGNGGKGGYSIGYINLQKNSTLYVAVGQQGPWAGGWNGGNQGQVKAGSATYAGGGGGGATHIATQLQGDGQLVNYVNNKEEILIVAGGGGGGTESGDAGGSGGGLTGGSTSAKYTSTGGTQTSGGTGGDTGIFGKGGACWYGSTASNTYGGGGGGGGWYGGGGGNSNTGGGRNTDNGGGGGSGYIGGVTSYNENAPATSNGVNSGNGYAIITLIKKKVSTMLGNTDCTVYLGATEIGSIYHGGIEL